MEQREHDFDGAFGACKGCGRYIEECMEHRYCTPKPESTFKFPTLADLLCNVGQFMDACKPEFGDQWSDYDECLRQAVSRYLREAIKPPASIGGDIRQRVNP